MPSLRVLLVKDTEEDATLVLRELRHAGYELVVVERVATADGLRAALALQAWDLITCDDTLAELSALAALALIRAHDGNVPIVVVSGQVGEERAAALIRAGADDLVLKHNVQRLPQAAQQALRDATNRRRISSAQAATHVTARKTTEHALREARASLEIAVMAARAGLWDWDLQTGETQYSESWRTLFGYSSAVQHLAGGPRRVVRPGRDLGLRPSADQVMFAAIGRDLEYPNSGSATTLIQGAGVTWPGPGLSHPVDPRQNRPFR